MSWTKNKKAVHKITHSNHRIARMIIKQSNYGQKMKSALATT